MTYLQTYVAIALYTDKETLADFSYDFHRQRFPKGRNARLIAARARLHLAWWQQNTETNSIIENLYDAIKEIEKHGETSEGVRIIDEERRAARSASESDMRYMPRVRSLQRDVGVLHEISGQ